ncbi:glycerophosphodiester phosphodiesterase [Thermoleophilia bacterium SCSIO 60948]|nr:glycerophosphodiester phosphodiesterase [Thermoleophilia bacterium SCSIO 60948]
MRRLLVASLILAFLLLPAAKGAGAGGSGGHTDWLETRTLNITHQGGEDEAPSNTMYAFDRSMRLGADMLEVDIHVTADDRVVVLHDANVDRTTNGTGSVYEKTLKQVQRLDSAYNFVPGAGAVADADRRDYVFRGVRTGKRTPPNGFSRRDFRIPTLREVMRAYPQVPINIEIKGRSDADQASFLANAERLAALLNRLGRTRGIIVASFSDAALNEFHRLAPQIDLAPATGEVAAYKAARVPPGEGRVAFQVPITFGGQQITDEGFVENAHEDGLAVHVWLSNDPENDGVYRQLLDWNVDGVMPAKPAAFERVLCRRDVARPPRPAGLPGRHCNFRRVSIACDVIPVGPLKLRGERRVAVRLERRDRFDGGCAGRLSIRVAGERAGGRFDFGRRPAPDGETARRVERLKLRGPAPSLLAAGAEARVTTRAYQAYGHSRVLRAGR